MQRELTTDNKYEHNKGSNKFVENERQKRDTKLASVRKVFLIG